ncbi:class I SAM-dependent methyltransferase [Aquimarina sp. D1M17]|uniref:class I SAM-dependent methyltransferase n=1 Tax=Aquimarina acroporae TaxID=2937283 RepID=UPI0020BEDD88|nr:class I SAM-dependent methyltransferase [Aquimarina acroporae]MCK8520213.1 class I SAM-dependent methyltransferase [Aquimarina acroporae]
MNHNRKLLCFLFLLFVVLSVKAQYKEYDWEERDGWMDVPEIFNLADIGEGSVVADIGCHEGYLTIHMSRKVGVKGKVYAVDVRKDRLEKLDEHLKSRKLNNVKTVLGDYDNPKLPTQQLDVVVIMDTYHEMDDYMVILEHVMKALKPNGRIVVIEKLKNHMRNKSRKEQTDAHTLSSKYVRKELKDAGFLITNEIKDFGNWENESAKKIWVLVGVKGSKS